jgi:hypothetical protein
MHEREQEPNEQAGAEATGDRADVRDEETRFITGWGDPHAQTRPRNEKAPPGERARRA